MFSIRRFPRYSQLKGDFELNKSDVLSLSKLKRDTQNLTLYVHVIIIRYVIIMHMCRGNFIARVFHSYFIVRYLWYTLCVFVLRFHVPISFVYHLNAYHPGFQLNKIFNGEVFIASLQAYSVFAITIFYT